MCIRFDLIPECDEETDRQTHRQTSGFAITVSCSARLSMTTGDKNETHFCRRSSNSRSAVELQSHVYDMTTAICWSVRPSICLFIHESISTCMSVCMRVCMSMCGGGGVQHCRERQRKTSTRHEIYDRRGDRSIYKWMCRFIPDCAEAAIATHRQQLTCSLCQLSWADPPTEWVTARRRRPVARRAGPLHWLLDHTTALAGPTTVHTVSAALLTAPASVHPLPGRQLQAADCRNVVATDFDLFPAKKTIENFFFLTNKSLQKQTMLYFYMQRHSVDN